MGVSWPAVKTSGLGEYAGLIDSCEFWAIRGCVLWGSACVDVMYDQTVVMLLFWQRLPFPGMCKCWESRYTHPCDGWWTRVNGEKGDLFQFLHDKHPNSIQLLMSRHPLYRPPVCKYRSVLACFPLYSEVSFMLEIYVWSGTSLICPPL